jgi:peptide/nickel transport system permease protein
MLRYTIRRLGQMCVVLMVLSFLVFAWLRSLPGGIESSICAERCTPDKVAALRSVLGLDDSVIVQYFKFLGRVLDGNFGSSAKVVPGAPALDVFLQRFPATIELSVGAMIFALVFGIPLGYVAAQRRGGIFDNLGVIGTLVGIAVPVFFLAYLLKYIFAVKLGWLPPSGRQDPTINATRVTGFFVIDGLITREWDAAWDAIKHLILPSLALGTIPLAVIFRITRSSVLDVLGEDYVRTAEAKGLAAPVIRRRHVLRNALLPVATVTGLQVGALLAGAVLTETVFAYPGIGAALAQSFREKDYPVLQVVILAAAGTFVLVNLAVDLSYAYIDPRIRTAGAKR